MCCNEPLQSESHLPAFMWIMALWSMESQWIQEVLWSILSVIQSCLWRLPSSIVWSRRWDHRTSLHRWQLRLKVSRSGGPYRLLARCEILSWMPSCLCQILYCPQRWDVTASHRGQRGKDCNFIVLLQARFFDQKAMMNETSVAVL